MVSENTKAQWKENARKQNARFVAVIQKTDLDWSYCYPILAKDEIEANSLCASYNAGGHGMRRVVEVIAV